MIWSYYNLEKDVFFTMSMKSFICFFYSPMQKSSHFNSSIWSFSVWICCPYWLTQKQNPATHCLPSKFPFLQHLGFLERSDKYLLAMAHSQFITCPSGESWAIPKNVSIALPSRSEQKKDYVINLGFIHSRRTKMALPPFKFDFSTPH